MTIIDCHAHLYPPPLMTFLEERGITIPFDADAVPKLLAEQERSGVGTSLISNPFLLQRVESVDASAVLEATRRQNEHAAELAAHHSGRLVPMAIAHPFWEGGDPSASAPNREAARERAAARDAMLREIERAVRELGCCGVMVNPQYGGRFLDEASVAPFWDLIEALDVTVFYHPAASVVTQEHLGRWRMVESVGRPLDTTIGLSRLVMSGFFERHPGVRLVAAHMGGGIVMLPGRLDYVYRMRPDTRFGAWEENGVQDLPSLSLRRIYVDTMGFQPSAIRLEVEVVGPEHVLFGSDHPPVTIPLSESVGSVREARLGAEAQAAVFEGNARHLFKL